MWTIFLFLFLYAGKSLAETESKVVEIEQGLLRGYKDTEGNFYSFYDVPYAETPTGRDKFKRAGRPKPWNGTFEAINRMITCPQSIPIPFQEDCLVASIFVPATKETNLPVLIHVHGGAYILGTGYFFPLTNFADSRNMIVVTFNYRLGVHGFLCLGSEDIPGNAGLKDQVELLRWVNRNIASFGGNPNDVTISGCSAGAGSVEFLSISFDAQGLFHKVITDSGAFIGGTGAQVDPRENARMYARHLNFTDTDNFPALEEFYRNASFELLLAGSDINNIDKLLTSLIFSPCVEADTSTGRVLQDAPLNILKSGRFPQVPMIYGFSNMEGLLRVHQFEELKAKMNEDFTVFIPDELQFSRASQKRRAARDIMNFYFGGQEVTDESIQGYIDYFSDIYFTNPMLRVADLRKDIGDIYLYMYAFTDENSSLLPNTNIRGANHCQQFYAVMDEDLSNATEEYKVIKQTMRQMWTDFIFTGNPTPPGSALPTWPPVTNYLSPHLIINTTSYIVNEPLLESRAKFWDYYYERYYTNPLSASAGNITASVSLVMCVFFVNYFVGKL